MSDAKPPAGEGPQGSSASEQPSSDRPPPDHTQPDQPPADHASPDHVSPDHAAADQPPSDRPPLDHVPPNESPRKDAPADQLPRDHVQPDQTRQSHAPPDERPRDYVPPDEPPLDDVPPESKGKAPPREGGIGEHLRSRDSWLRVLFMVLFAALWSISRLVVFAVIGLQVLFLLFSGRRDARLAGLGASLAVYSYELVAYLTFVTERQPFPFSDWPDGSTPADEADRADTD